MTIRYDNKVVIVTGAGGGLGRAHALEFAKRGAKVVVNDLGGAVDGTGGNSAAAEAVVKEIADAGILRDKSFSKMELKDFDAVMAVHVMGTVKPAKAMWQIMRDQQYGRIVVTTSSTGLYGNFGQTNYGTAKLGLVGFMNTLKLEGAKDNIKVNAICPVAGTRMTENLMPPEMVAALKPEYVTPAVVFLASDDAPTGCVISAAAGAFSSAQIVESNGVNLGHAATADDVAANWGKISDFTGAKHFNMGGEHSAHFFALIQGQKTP